MSVIENNTKSCYIHSCRNLSMDECGGKNEEGKWYSLSPRLWLYLAAEYLALDDNKFLIGASALLLRTHMVRVFTLGTVVGFDGGFRVQKYV